MVSKDDVYSQVDYRWLDRAEIQDRVFEDKGLVDISSNPFTYFIELFSRSLALSRISNHLGNLVEDGKVELGNYWEIHFGNGRTEPEVRMPSFAGELYRRPAGNNGDELYWTPVPGQDIEIEERYGELVTV